MVTVEFSAVKRLRRTLSARYATHMAARTYGGLRGLGHARSRISSNWRPGAMFCPCCTKGPPRGWKRADRRLVRHAGKQAWHAEVEADLWAEEQEIIDYVIAIVHGEHPMEDVVDRAMGLYPGTDVEVSALAPKIRVPLPLR